MSDFHKKDNKLKIKPLTTVEKLKARLAKRKDTTDRVFITKTFNKKVWSTEPIPKPEPGKILVVRTFATVMDMNKHIYNYFTPNKHKEVPDIWTTGEDWYCEGDIVSSPFGFKTDWQIAEFTI